MLAARSLGAALLGGAALAGCSLAPARDDAAFPLLPPASLGTTLERQQVLHLAAGETTARFQCVVRVTPQALVVVGLGPLGQRLFSIHWDGAELRSETAPGAGALPPPERIVADLQMALWPLPALAAATAGTRWQVLEADAGVRRVMRAGRSYAEIHRESADPWNGRLWLVNFPHGYSLAIESRPLAS